MCRYQNDAGRAEIMAKARDAFAVAHTRLQFLKERFREGHQSFAVQSYLQRANDSVIAVETIASVMPTSGPREDMEVWDDNVEMCVSRRRVAAKLLSLCHH